MDKRYDQYTMRDDFDIVVNFSETLVKDHGRYGIIPEASIAGRICKRGGTTILQIATIPVKDKTKESDPLFNEDNLIETEKDTHGWYARSIDGSVYFTIRKFYWKKQEIVDDVIFPGKMSTWVLTDYSITDEFIPNDRVHTANIAIDKVPNWFNLPVNFKVCIGNVEYKKIAFNISFSAGYIVTRTLSDLTYKNTFSIFIKLHEEQDRNVIYQIARTLRNFFQLFIDSNIGISKILLNTDLIRTPENPNPSYAAENWFIAKNYLPEVTDDERAFGDYKYNDIAKDFATIIRYFFSNEDLQELVDKYLLIDQSYMPIPTRIITLTSAVDSYLKKEKYESNNKIVTNLKEKMKRFIRIGENDFNSKKSNQRIKLTDEQTMIDSICDSRDYYVHNVKKDKISDENELIRYLSAFLKIYHKVLLSILLSQEN